MRRPSLLGTTLDWPARSQPTAQASTTLGQNPDFGFTGDTLGGAVGCTLLQSKLQAIDRMVPAEPACDHVAVVGWRVLGADGTARLRRLTTFEFSGAPRSR